MTASAATLTTDPSLIELAATCGEEVEFPRGRVIFAQGEPGGQLYIIQSGKVKIGKKAADGREHLLALHWQSEVFGALDLFDPGPREASATAVTEARVITIDRAICREWINADPGLAVYLLRHLGASARRLGAQLSDQILSDMPAWPKSSCSSRTGSASTSADSCASPTT